MDKTIKHLKAKGFLNRLRLSIAMADVIFKAAEGCDCTEKAKKNAVEQLLMKELTKDTDLLNAVIDDISNEIIKHI